MKNKKFNLIIFLKLLLAFFTVVGLFFLYSNLKISFISNSKKALLIGEDKKFIKDLVVYDLGDDYIVQFENVSLSMKRYFFINTKQKKIYFVKYPPILISKIFQIWRSGYFNFLDISDGVKGSNEKYIWNHNDIEFTYKNHLIFIRNKN